MRSCFAQKLGRMQLSVFVAAVALVCPSALAFEPPRIRHIAEVLSLSTEEAAKGLPVQLHGVVTYYDPERKFLFVQDSADGIYVHMIREEVPLARGQSVEVVGLTGEGCFRRIVKDASLRVLGAIALPAPKPTKLAQLVTGSEDGRFVEISGVVRRLMTREGHHNLFLVEQGKTVRAKIRDKGIERSVIDRFLDARVRLRGVCGVHISKSKRTLEEVFVNLHDLSDLEILEAAPAVPFAMAPTPIASLKLGTEHRMKVQGRLFLTNSGELTITDATGSIQVCAQDSSRLRAGDTVEALGFLSDKGPPWSLEDSLLRPLAPPSSRGASGKPTPGEMVPVLLTAASVRNLESREASRGLPIRLRATVTYMGPAWGMLFVQDASGGIYVCLDASVNTPFLDSKQIVDIEGYSDPGQFAPVVRAHKITVVAQGEMPAPIRYPNFELLTGVADSQWIALEAVVQGVVLEESHVILILWVKGDTIRAYIPIIEQLEAAKRLIGAEITVRGACGAIFNQKRQALGMKLFVPSLQEIGVIRPAPADCYSLPLVAIDQVLSFRPDAPAAYRTHISGVVTWQSPDGSFYLQEEANGICVELLSPAIVNCGDRLDVVGFPSVVGKEVRLRYALHRTVSQGHKLSPRRMRPKEAAAEAGNACLVRVEGRLLGVLEHPEGLILTAEEDGCHFEAHLVKRDLPGPPPHFVPGSRMAFDGIGRIVGESSDPRGSLQIFLRNPDDLTVLEHPPWWSFWHALLLVGGIALVTLCCLAWVVSLRRQVSYQLQLLRRKDEHLRQAMKMEAVGRLAGGVAHDFNNLLTVINGNVELLLEAPDPTYLNLDALEGIRDAGERATTLTRQLLSFARKQAVTTEVIDLNSHMRDMVGLLKRLVGENIRITTNFSPERVRVRIDTAQLQQVVVNLVINARDAMPQGGDVFLSTQRSEVEKRPMMALEVRDCGCGMSEDLKAHIFEPFFTTKDQGKGTGLGLATVYAIVKQANGEIRVESTPGKGTTFWILLPETTEETRPTPKPSTPQPQATANECILIAEDEPGVRSLAAAVLRQHGYAVIVAETGTEAASLFKTEGKSIQLLLTDVVMPGMTGRQLAEQLRAVQPDLRVLFMSGYNEDEILMNGVRESEIHLLNKPFGSQMLLAKVREALESPPSSFGFVQDQE